MYSAPLGNVSYLIHIQLKKPRMWLKKNEETLGLQSIEHKM